MIVYNQRTAPIESLRFVTIDANGDEIREYVDGKTISFNADDEHSFRCEASGSNPAADVRITLGSNDLT